MLPNLIEDTNVLFKSSFTVSHVNDTYLLDEWLNISHSSEVPISTIEFSSDKDLIYNNGIVVGGDNGQTDNKAFLVSKNFIRYDSSKTYIVRLRCKTNGSQVKFGIVGHTSEPTLDLVSSISENNNYGRTVKSSDSNIVNFQTTLIDILTHYERTISPTTSYIEYVYVLENVSVDVKFISPFVYCNSDSSNYTKLTYIDYIKVETNENFNRKSIANNSVTMLYYASSYYPYTTGYYTNPLSNIYNEEDLLYNTRPAHFLWTDITNQSQGTWATHLVGNYAWNVAEDSKFPFNADGTSNQYFITPVSNIVAAFISVINSSNLDSIFIQLESLFTLATNDEAFIFMCWTDAVDDYDNGTFVLCPRDTNRDNISLTASGFDNNLQTNENLTWLRHTPPNTASILMLDRTSYLEIPPNKQTIIGIAGGTGYGFESDSISYKVWASVWYGQTFSTKLPLIEHKRIV